MMCGVYRFVAMTTNESLRCFVQACLVYATLGKLLHAYAQLSSPVASNSHVSVDGNRFLERRAQAQTFEDELRGPGEEATDTATCPQNVQLKWMAEVTSSVYATPLITDLFADGTKDIIVPSFVHYLDVLQGDNGAQVTGFPAFHEAKVHASPLLHDIDHDGILDILLATYDGEILFYKDTGEQLPNRLIVPKLRVTREWYVGLDDDGVDHSRPDVDDPANPIGERVSVDAMRQQIGERMEAATRAQAGTAQTRGDAAIPQRGEDAKDGGGQLDGGAVAGQVDSGAVTGEVDGGAVSGEVDSGAVPGDAAGEVFAVGGGQQRRLLDTNAGSAADDGAQLVGDGVAAEATGAVSQDAAGAAGDSAGGTPTVTQDPDGGPSEEAVDSFDSLDSYWDAELDEADYYGFAAAHNEFGLSRGDHRLRGEDDDPQLHQRYMESWLDEYVYDEGYLHGEWWDEDGPRRPPYPLPPPGDVYIDAHIMCTPAIADLDGDGRDELVVPVTYLFDRTYYDSPEHRDELDAGVDASMYLASGVVAFDLALSSIKWSQHLDLTTDHVDFRAYVYSSPTLADLDRDGKLETIIGTSVGYLYVLDHRGDPRPGWPVQMGEIQGQPAVADVDGDGRLEIVAADTRGNVALFAADGRVLWDAHVGAAVSQHVTFGDVDGDGDLEVVLGTNAGAVVVLSATTGEAVKGFPFYTSGRIVAPILVTRLKDAPSQQIVVVSFDGFLNIIDGLDACADVVDIGDTSYASVLADDLDGNSQLDLLVATMSGHIYAFETPAEYHPLKARPEQVPGRSVFVAQHDWVGVYATEMTRRPKDIRGTTFPVEFEIIVKRQSAAERAAAAAADSDAPSAEFQKAAAPYTVKVMLQNIGTGEMNAGEQPVIGMSDVYQAPGKYHLEIPCPRSRSTALVHIELADADGVVYVHQFAQSFHMNFHRLLKWMIAAPLLGMGLFILVLKPENSVLLPA